MAHFKHDNLPDAVELQSGDKLLLLDSGWGFVEEYPPLLKAAHEAGAEVVGCLYDLIPLRYPAATAVKNSAPFTSWFETCCCVRRDRLHLAKRRAGPCRLSARKASCDACQYANRLVAAWRGFCAPAHTKRPRKRREQIASAPTPFFMSVGTLEPRKAYPVALDAFESLWSEGCDARYVIVGRPGWNTRALQRRIREHAEFGRRLFWLDNASDADLFHLYPRARGLDLPVLRRRLRHAARSKPRITALASSRATFRSFAKSAGTGRSISTCSTRRSLAARVKEALASSREVTPPAVVNWAQSAARLAAIMRENDYQIDAAALKRALGAV